MRIRDVRKAAIQNVAVTKVTYRDLVIRIRDVSDEVRAAAFHVFRDQVQFKDIPINDRAQLLDQGLQDRSPAVRTACEQMLVDRWLPDNNYSPARLLRALDVEHFAALCTRVSKLLIHFHTTNHPFEPVVPCINVADVLEQRDETGAFTGDLKDALDGASVFFWREQCVYFQDDDKDEEKLAALLPSISDYIKVLRIAATSGEEEMMFMMQQLLALGRSLDFQDEYGRRILLESLRTFCRGSS
jgi:condensin complex subunit 3